MKLIGAVFGVVALCATSVWAQTSETTTKTKIKIKDGKDISVTGCVQPMATGSGFMLTNVADKEGALHTYFLVSDDHDWSKHVGHRVQIEGKAADQGDGKLQTETKTKTKVENGEDREVRGKTEVKGDLGGLPFLGVKSMKMIAASCP